MSSRTLPWPLAVTAGLAVAILGCGSPSTPAKTASATLTAPPTPIASVSASATPAANPPSTPTPSPNTASASFDPTQSDQVALALYAGGGTSLTGRFDCLTTTASCPVTARLMARLSAFSDARQAHNSGGGSSDPFCRGCQAPFVSLTVTSWATNSTGAIVYVSLSQGGVMPLAIIEVGEEGGDYLVDDVECVNAGAPDPQTSLYVITNTSDTNCPLADAG
jgi:hypothetical protein